MADWTLEDGDRDEWLARWLDDGWRCAYPWGSAETTMHGRSVHRHAHPRRDMTWRAERSRAVPCGPNAAPCPVNR